MVKRDYDLIETDVLIVGAGGAGLRAAIEAYDKGADVVVVSKTLSGKAHTVMAEGGINAALGNVDPADNWKVHALDTLKEGQFIGDWRMVEILCKEAKKTILELERWGVVFDRSPDGRIMQRPFGAQTYRRTCYVGDRTGLEILQVLLQETMKRNIKILDEILITKSLVRAGRIVGATGIDLKSGKFLFFKAKTIILATGGYIRVFERTSTSWESVGDGQALAYLAGAELMDMEMVQFHPTGMVYPKSAEGILVTEAVRGEGGILLNSKGERFMEKYDPKRMELSARDVVARAIHREIQEGMGTEHDGVYLDISFKPTSFVKRKLPRMVKQFMDFAGVDITKERMEVAPTAHYTMGGIMINPETCGTRIKGLFAAGEVAASVHGANRLGGNSLLDILVFGRRAGKAAAYFSKNIKLIDDRKILADVRKEYERITAPFNREAGINPSVIKDDVRKIMWGYVGIVRDEKNLKKALEELEKLKSKLKKVSVRGSLKYNPGWLDYIDVSNMLIICESIIRSAITRKESRGAHFREDYPERDDKNWLVNIVCKKGKNGKMKVSKSRVPAIKGELKEIVCKR